MTKVNMFAYKMRMSELITGNPLAWFLNPGYWVKSNAPKNHKQNLDNCLKFSCIKSKGDE